jgi:photosystem II stability/assembly factor-like uncharacterized protein
MKHSLRTSVLVAAAFALLAAFPGPAIAQWIQTAGPEGGGITSIFQDGADLFAGAYGNGGVFKSTDGGSTWEQKISGMGYQSVTAIDRSGSFLLATGTVGLYRSTDAGETWTAASGLPAGNGVTSLAVDGATVYGGTQGGGMYVSTDDGATWSAANTNLPNSFGYTYVGGIVKAASGVLAAVTDNSTYGVYRTTDAGGTWTKVDNGLPAWTQLNSLTRDGSVIYGGATNVFKSTDDGVNWTVAGTGIPDYSGIDEIAVGGSAIFAAGAGYVYRSTDGGTTWSALGGGLPVMTMTSLEIAGSTIYAGTIAGGVYASTDNGDTWTQRASGLLARDMGGFLADGATLYGNGNGIFATTDGGDTWGAIRGDLRDSIAQPTLVYADGATLFCRGYPLAGLSRSTDGGTTWTECGAGLSPFGSVQSIVSAGGALFTVSNRIYRSTDNGDTWVQVDSALGAFVSLSNITKVGGTLFAYGMAIARSTDDGATWVLADNGIPDFFTINGIASAGGALFTGGGFPNANYKSTDNGDTWTVIANLPSFSQATQFLGNGGDLFACGENNGVFLSTNLGTSWTNISAGLPSPNYRFTLAIHNGTMYAGTSGNSVWKRPLSDVTAVEPAGGAVPSGFALRQNYPNPFNPATEVRFEVASRERVRIGVYDVLGRLAAVLVDGELSPGAYTVDWDASSSPSGVYYARMSAGAFSATVKMLLVR